VAPARAANSAWVAEKIRVTFVLMPSAVRVFVAGGHGYFYDNVFMDFRQFAGFRYHAAVLFAYYLRADGAVHDGRDFLHHFDKVAALLGDKGRVGGYPANYAPAFRFPYMGRVGGVNE
jgi:hypothetical protein